MNTRLLSVLGGLLLGAAVAAGCWMLASGAPGVSEDMAPLGSLAPRGSLALPVPPVPPRVAAGQDYEKCLDLLENDPTGATAFSLGWSAGGEGAAHCLALSKIALGQPAEGAALLEAMAGRSIAPPAVRAMLFGQAGQAWVMADDNDRAYAAMTRAVGLLGDDVELLIERAGIASSLERHDDAIADLDQVLARDPTRTDAMTQRAATLRKLNRLDAADGEIARALALDADYPEALLERGILRQRKGDTEGARADWDRVIELDPDSPAADLAEQNLALLDAGPDNGPEPARKP